MNGPLAGVRILDLTDERAIYGAKLLADLGADVVRPEPPSGDPLRSRGPHLDNGTSLWHVFFGSNRRFFRLDLSSLQGQADLRALLGVSEIVLTSPGAFAVDKVEEILAEAERKGQVVVDTSSFGSDGPWSDFQAPDLVAGALGGAVAITGDADTPPLKCFGELNFMTVGAYTAIAALSALYRMRETSAGQRVEVSAHEAIVSCLEHVLMWYWYAHTRPARPEQTLPRRGSRHWSNAYEIMQAKDGAIMVTPTPNVSAHVNWLEEMGAIDDLRDPHYREQAHLFMPRLMELTRAYVATREVEDLFFEAQSRHMPFGWVLPLDKVAGNPQLAARNWWKDYRVGEEVVRGPGAPYHFSETPWQMGDYRSVDDCSKALLEDLEWGIRDE